ncbi:MAG: DHA2 family efflux MFS transporter permease subunit [Acidimicrobiales bacterium]|jgi:EmrB/QacA subfamily drug resistance transporter
MMQPFAQEKQKNRTSQRWWALIALSAAVLAVGIDLTVLNVALPTLAKALHASTSQLQWFVDSYSLVLAALLLPAGLLADRFGRKRLLLVALVVFAASSAACAYAGSPVALIATRAVLGAGAAVIMTVSLSILAVLFPTDEERQKATAVVMACTMVGYPLGPLLGGWLLDHFWWGSVFLINVPVVAVALVAIAVLMPESRSARAPRLDAFGVAVSSLGLMGLTYGVIQAGQDGWGSTRAVTALVAGAVGLIAFVAWERHLLRRGREPLVDLGLFRSARFTWGTVLATMVSFAMFGLLFVMPQYFQNVMGQNPLGSGIRLLPMVGGLVVGAGLATRLQEARTRGGAAMRSGPRVGANIVVAIGFAVMASGLFLGAGTEVGSGTARAALWFTISGFGLGFVLPASMNAALGALSPERAGIGSGLIMACRQVGATIGVALLGTVLNSVYRQHVDVGGLPAAVAQLVREGVASGMVAAQRLADAALGRSVQSAFVTSMDVMLVVCGGIALTAMVLALVYLPRREAAASTASPSTLDPSVVPQVGVVADD